MVWKAKVAKRRSPRIPPRRKKPWPSGRRRHSTTGASTATATPKRATRKTPGEDTSSTFFTNVKVVPQNKVRTRSAESATRTS